MSNGFASALEISELFQDSADDKQRSAEQRETGFHPPAPYADDLHPLREGPRNFLACSLFEFFLPSVGVRLSVVYEFSHALAEHPCGDDTTGECQQHNEKRQSCPPTVKNAVNRTKNQPIGRDQRVAHLQARVGEIASPISKFAGYLFQGILWALIQGGLRAGVR